MKRKHYSRIVASVISFASTGVFASSILPIQEYNESIRTFSWSTEIWNLQKRRLTQKAPCIIEQEEKMFLISPSCLTRSITTGMSEDEVMKLIMPYVIDIPVVYNTASPIFSYEATTPIFSKKLFPVNIRDPLDYAFLLDLQKKWTKIKISDLQLAYIISKSWSWYGVWKWDIWSLKPCTKQNYYVAFSSLSDYVRASWTDLNLNDIISHRAGYCKGTGPKNLMFYGGVCGFATQLFRLSLLIPNVDIVERYWHSQRYVPYYSEYIFGDDAALYQNNKKLILKNNLSTNIYLKTLDKWTATYLIAIVPQKINSYVEIRKEQIWNLKWEVTKIVKNFKDSRIAQNFISYYTQRTYVVR
jgi:hypothetical protein